MGRQGGRQANDRSGHVLPPPGRMMSRRVSKPRSPQPHTCASGTARPARDGVTPTRVTLRRTAVTPRGAQEGQNPVDDQRRESLGPFRDPPPSRCIAGFARRHDRLFHAPEGLPERPVLARGSLSLGRRGGGTVPCDGVLATPGGRDDVRGANVTWCCRGRVGGTASSPHVPDEARAERRRRGADRRRTRSCDREAACGPSPQAD